MNMPRWSPFSAGSGKYITSVLEGLYRTFPGGGAVSNSFYDTTLENVLQN